MLDIACIKYKFNRQQQDFAPPKICAEFCHIHTWSMQSEHLLDMIQRILRSDQGYSQHAQISADWESESYWSALIIADFHQLIHNQFWSALINTMNNLSALIFLQIWPDQNWIIGRSKIRDDQCADLAGVERRPLIHFWSGLIVYTFNADSRSYMIIPDSGNADNSIIDNIDHRW